MRNYVQVSRVSMNKLNTGSALLLATVLRRGSLLLYTGVMLRCCVILYTSYIVYILDHHFYFPALWTSHGNQCLPSPPPVLAYICIEGSALFASAHQFPWEFSVMLRRPLLCAVLGAHRGFHVSMHTQRRYMV